MADTKKNIFEDIDENSDQRLLDLQTEHGFAVGDVSGVYDWEISKNDIEKNHMLGALDKSHQAGVNELNAATDAVVSGLEEKKDEAEDSYDIEAKAAYTDWQKASDPYGVNAEQMASMGMSNTGYSETSKVAMYNQYQNRVAVARATFNKATADYDRAIADAKMQNNVALARLASETYLKQAELSLYYLQKHDELLSQKEKALEEVNSIYATKWQDILKQMKEEEKLTVGGNANNPEGNPLSTVNMQAAKQAAQNSMSRPSLAGDMPIDRNSLIALGYGNKSMAELNQLVRAGVIVPYVINGKLYFREGK